MAGKNSLKDNLKAVRQRIAEAAVKARRDPAGIQLVVVTKGQPISAVRQAIELGELDLGESRVQDLRERAATAGEFLAQCSEGLHRGVRWHMIGHLQRNKVKSLLPLVHMVHSVDTLRLAEAIDETARKLTGQPVPILLEVNCSGERQKFGVPVGAVQHLAEQISSLKGVQLLGVMTMAPVVDDAEKARPTFIRMRELFEEMVRCRWAGPTFRHLSMGMSQDYGVAIEEGATIVRIGTAIFQGT